MKMKKFWAGGIPRGPLDPPMECMISHIKQKYKMTSQNPVIKTMFYVLGKPITMIIVLSTKRLCVSVCECILDFDFFQFPLRPKMKSMSLS